MPQIFNRQKRKNKSMLKTLPIITNLHKSAKSKYLQSHS
jgi:hypothetical protein